MINNVLIGRALLCALISSANVLPKHTYAIGAPAPSADLSASDPIQDQGASVQTKPTVFVAEGRMRFVTPSRPVVAAEPNAIELELAGGVPAKLLSDQTAYYDDAGILEGIIARSDTTYVVQVRDGHTYIEVIPLRVGRIRIDLTGIYSDGGIAFTRLLVDVVSSAKTPTRLLVGNSGRTNSEWVFLESPDTSERAKSARIYVGAEYEGVNGLIDLFPRDVRFAIRSGKESPAFVIDPQTGMLTPLHVGEGLLETTLAGTTNLTCVIVLGPNAVRLGNCNGLLVEGEKLSPQGFSQYELAPRKAR